MENVQIDAVIAQNRKPFSILGSTLGTQYCKIESRLSIPEFDKKKLENEQSGGLNLMLNRSPRRYVVKTYDIKSVEAGINAEGSPIVTLNKDDEQSEVRIPMIGEVSKIGMTTDEAIKKSLMGDKTVFFSNVSKTCDEMNVLNRGEIARIDDMIMQLNKFKQHLLSAIDDNNRKKTMYETQYNQSCGTVSVSIDENND